MATYLRQELHIDPLRKFENESYVPLYVRRQQAIEWVSEGAADEDDTFSRHPLRYRNHFYNPLDGRGLHYGPVTGGLPSPTWGLEDINDVFRQDFSFNDARQAFYDALWKPGAPDRADAFVRTFLALGHVIHLIQDMAQPQHTRNDPHGAGSLYELFTDDHRGDIGFPYGGYAPVYREDDTATFAARRDFWHRADGKGIADFSNREFVSAGTNFRIAQNTYPLLDYNILPASGFPYPNGQEASVTTTTIEDLLASEGGTTLRGEIDFIVTPVHDAYTGEWRTDRRTSTYSIFDPELQEAGKALAPTLNGFNFRDAWELLIPRAVGYSAGLLNYFFRGRLDVVPDPRLDRWFVVTNRGPETMTGTFALYYDDDNGTRQPFGSTQRVLGPGQAASILTSPLPFSRKLVPPDYTAVFDGTMGAETPNVKGHKGAVVGKAFRGSPFLVVSNDVGYRARFVDQGWNAIGGGHQGQAGFDNQGFYVDDTAIFVSGGSLLKSVGGGQTYVDLAPMLFGLDAGLMTYLGGTELLAVGPGRIQYSADCGNSWQSQTLGLQVYPNSLLGVGSAGVLLAGLGFTSPSHLSWLFRSLDNGATWTEAPAQVDGTPLQGCTYPDPPQLFDRTRDCAEQWYVHSMTWNQLDGADSVILAAGEIWHLLDLQWGVWKSTDGGSTWRMVFPLAGACGGGPTSIAMSPSGDALLVFDYCDPAGEWQILYKSTDAGESWALAQNPGPIEGVTQSVMYLGNERQGDTKCPE